MHQYMMIQIREIFMHAYKLHVTVRSLRLPGFYFYPERFPELPHGFGEGFIFNFHIELEDVAAFFTPETVADLLIRRSEEHTSELQSRFDLVCRLLLEKKKHID